MNILQTLKNKFDVHVHPMFEYNYIIDGIYVGTNLCCQVHFSEVLKKEGITVDISMEDDHVDAPFGIDFFLWIPTKDHTALDIDKLKFAVEMLDGFVQDNRKIYVHCQHGHGRSPMLVCAYLIKKGNTAKQAELIVQTQRPAMHFDDNQRSALQEFERHCKGETSS